jgi:hypothetical protein
LEYAVSLTAGPGREEGGCSFGVPTSDPEKEKGKFGVSPTNHLSLPQLEAIYQLRFYFSHQRERVFKGALPTFYSGLTFFLVPFHSGFSCFFPVW